MTLILAFGQYEVSVCERELRCLFCQNIHAVFRFLINSFINNHKYILFILHELVIKTEGSLQSSRDLVIQLSSFV